MFLGELLCIFPFIYFYFQSKQKKKRDPEVVKSTEDTPFHYIFAAPTICDLTASTLGNVAMLFIHASVWQMMRGAIIVFSGIFSIVFLKRKLYLHNWIGMVIVCCGLLLVGVSSMIKGNSETSGMLQLLGILLVVGAQLIAALQMVVEESLLKSRSYHPTNVVFMEGFWGVTFMICIFFPILNATPHLFPTSPEAYNVSKENPAVLVYNENFIDALVQMRNFPLYLILDLVVLLSIAFFNFFGLSVTRSLSAVHRTLIDACRTIFVWSVQVLLFIIDPVTFKHVGEELSLYSLLQLGGFIFLIIGTLIYNEILRLPKLTSYAQKEKDQEAEKKLLNIIN